MILLPMVTMRVMWSCLKCFSVTQSISFVEQELSLKKSLYTIRQNSVATLPQMRYLGNKSFLQLECLDTSIATH